jgi:hypothetical protein
MAEWEIQRFGAYREKATLPALNAGPILILNLPVLVIDITGGKVAVAARAL